MVTSANPFVDTFDDDSTDRFEKIARRSIWGVPSSKARAARRAAAKTPSSKRVARHVSKSLGGKHRRRRQAWH